MFLVDTNVWLEVLLEQENAEEARHFLERADPHLLYVTEFSVYSLGIILIRLRKDALFEDFVSDVLEESGVRTIRLLPADLRHLIAVRRQLLLDFDDAYQYVAAEKYHLTLVSFDRVFERTALGRRTPSQALQG